MRHRAAAALGAGAALLGAVGRLALPPVCLACREPVETEGGLCPACWAQSHLIAAPFCARLGTPFPYDGGDSDLISTAAILDPPAFDRARAVAVHAGPVRDIVHALKYADRLDLAPHMAGMMARRLDDLDTPDVVVPVPLHWTRLWRRRFNQAAELARPLARRAGVPFLADTLARIRATPHQVGLNRAARHANMAGAFAVRPGGVAALAGRAVLLVDDVMTSGATADAAARALRRAGARRVDVLVFATVPDRSFT